MAAVTVSPKYQVVIPREVRERHSIQPGDKVEVFDLGGRIELVPVKPMKELKGLLQHRVNDFSREEDRCLR